MFAYGSLRLQSWLAKALLPSLRVHSIGNRGIPVYCIVLRVMARDVFTWRQPRGLAYHDEREECRLSKC
jgi:hypothetical protein